MQFDWTLLLYFFIFASIILLVVSVRVNFKFIDLVNRRVKQQSQGLQRRKKSAITWNWIATGAIVLIFLSFAMHVFLSDVKNKSK